MAKAANGSQDEGEQEVEIQGQQTQGGEAKSNDDLANRASPDGVTINVDKLKGMVNGLIADVSHAVKHNAPAAPGFVTQLKAMLEHLGGN